MLMHDDDKPQDATRTGDILLARALTCAFGIDTRCGLHVKSSIGTSTPIDSPFCATGSSFVGGVFLDQFSPTLTRARL